MDIISELIQQVEAEERAQSQAEKRREHFRKIGRLGGLAKRKSAKNLTRKVTVRFTEKEVKDFQADADKYGITLSYYLRLLATHSELKVNEFKTDEILISYASNFSKITNLLRHREWSEFENKKKILSEIETVVGLMRDYFLNKNIHE